MEEAQDVNEVEEVEDEETPHPRVFWRESAQAIEPKRVVEFRSAKKARGLLSETKRPSPERLHVQGVIAGQKPSYPHGNPRNNIVN